MAADGVHGRKRERERVDMPTTKWRAGCASGERLSKFSECRERKWWEPSTNTLSRERERDLTKKKCLD
jgi:hypothetical protein